MEPVEQLMKTVERMRAMGVTEKEVAIYVDHQVAANTARMLARLRMQDRVVEAMS